MKPMIGTLLLLCSMSWAQANELRIVTEDLPPKQMRVNGKLTGFAVEIVQALLDDLQQDTPIEMLPWTRAYRLAQQRKNTLIFGVARTAKREKAFQWVGSIDQVVVHFYKLKTRQDIAFEGLNDIKNYRIIAKKNSAIRQLLGKLGASDRNLVDVIRQQGVQMVFRGRADLILGDDIVFPYFLQRQGYSIDQFEKLIPLPGMKVNVEIAFSKTSTPALVERFRQSLERLKQSGRFEHIRARYLSPQSAPSPSN